MIPFVVGYPYATALMEIMSPGGHLAKFTKALMKVKHTCVLSLDLMLVMLNWPL